MSSVAVSHLAVHLVMACFDQQHLETLFELPSLIEEMHLLYDRHAQSATEVRHTPPEQFVSLLPSKSWSCCWEFLLGLQLFLVGESNRPGSRRCPGNSLVARAQMRCERVLGLLVFLLYSPPLAHDVENHSKMINLPIGTVVVAISEIFVVLLVM